MNFSKGNNGGSGWMEHFFSLYKVNDQIRTLTHNLQIGSLTPYKLHNVGCYNIKWQFNFLKDFRHKKLQFSWRNHRSVPDKHFEIPTYQSFCPLHNITRYGSGRDLVEGNDGVTSTKFPFLQQLFTSLLCVYYHVVQLKYSPVLEQTSKSFFQNEFASEKVYIQLV